MILQIYFNVSKYVKNIFTESSLVFQRYTIFNIKGLKFKCIHCQNVGSSLHLNPFNFHLTKASCHQQKSQHLLQQKRQKSHRCTFTHQRIFKHVNVGVQSFRMHSSASSSLNGEGGEVKDYQRRMHRENIKPQSQPPTETHRRRR